MTDPALAQTTPDAGTDPAGHAAPHGAPRLTVKDLRVHFGMPKKHPFTSRRDYIKAVDGITFDLHPGETLGIVGESGCGKSTLGRAILRLIPATDGKIVWLGDDLLALGGSEMRRRRQDMQIIFQDPLASLNPRMTIGDIIAEPLKTFNPGMPSAEVKAKVRDWMAQVGLVPDMINRYPHEFSGGQCQRIGIARAMVLNPKLVICDEPVSALDVSIQSQIINLLMKLQREFDLSLVFISHDLSVVRHISHRIMVLYLGKLVEVADRDSLYDNPRHPYTQALISAVPLPDPDAERAKRRIVLTGDLPSPVSPPSGCYFRTRCPKATDRCAAEEPPLHQIGPGHRAACHYWDTPMPVQEEG